MAGVEARRSALIVGCPERSAPLAEAVRQAGWAAAEADGFGHARFLIAMTAVEAAVVAADADRPGFADGLAWVAGQLVAPPVLVCDLCDGVAQAAARHGVLWMPAEGRRHAAMLAALLEQAHGLGRRRAEAVEGAALLGDSQAHVERLLQMLWHSAPLAGRPRWLTQRHVMERLEEEVERCRRGGAPLALVLGELDAPPTMPPTEADRLAGWLADTVAEGKRRSDVAGQYGRRGFLMVLPQTTTEQAKGACQRLRRVLADPPHAAGRVHARLALAEAAGQDATVPALLRRAEENLQRAREGGDEA